MMGLSKFIFFTMLLCGALLAIIIAIVLSAFLIGTFSAIFQSFKKKK